MVVDGLSLLSPRFAGEREEWLQGSCIQPIRPVHDGVISLISTWDLHTPYTRLLLMRENLLWPIDARCKAGFPAVHGPSNVPTPYIGQSRVTVIVQLYLHSMISLAERVSPLPS